MKSFINFEYMITPGILKILSYVGMVISVIVGLFTTFTADAYAGISMVVLGPIACRIYAELMLVIFECHKTLKEIRDK
ncbi:MAG TPA: hypothetical protein DCM40_37920 [Maribacter sp.]|jgi:hypothetical protein|nr:hypothetical protein [Maribacter sp.]